MIEPKNYSPDVEEATFPPSSSLFFAYHDAHPLALAMAIFSKMGGDWVEWEAETLRWEIAREFNVSSISPANWEKIQAVRALMLTVGFWAEWHIFEKILQALNNNIPQFDTLQACTIPQIMAGIDMASEIRPGMKFSEEVALYVAACALEEGVTYLPDNLEFAQNALTSPSYYCKDCGNVDDDDLMDGRCDFCVGRFQGDHPLNMKPSEGVPDNVGRNIVKFQKRDPSGAKDRYELLLARGPENDHLSEDSPEDVQAGKLYVAYEYTELRKAQKERQYKGLKSWML